MKETEEDLSPNGQSRRRWVVTSAAVVAGAVTACGTDSGGGSVDANCYPGDTPPAELPSFDAERCTDQIASPVLAPDDDRFIEWNEALRANAGGRESALVDLDAVDHNLKLVGQTLGSSIALRLVAKSLPSIQLLEYMMVTACTNRIMAFSEGMVRDLLCRFGSDVDILLGRPEAVDAAARTFDTLDARSSGGVNPAAGVRWLVDTADRMQQYADLATERGAEINIAVEIDVGLRRGGARDNDELLAMLAVIGESPLLRFTGFMGYDGHVPFTPQGADPTRELRSVQQRYTDFVSAGRSAYPSMFQGPLVYNSGGSRTYHYYTDELDTPVNEVAMGSAFFYPRDFSNIPDEDLRRATFLATPVLKRIDPAEAPFAPGFLPRLAEGNPDYEVQFIVVAGGFPGDQLYPEGLVVNPVTSSAAGEDDSQGGGVVNLLSNQAEWLGARAVPLGVGDFIFYHPWEGDGVRWLSRLDVFRGGELVDQWATFQPGIRSA
jgi:D-serine deaminase-like pyridoxal phosphate-dependent protein